jgi:hypothetical protein
MAVDLDTVITALGAALGSTSGLGLRTYTHVPDQIAIPCIVVVPDSISYPMTERRAMDVITLHATVYVSRADDRGGQAKLLPYLDSSGATSVRAAIEADVTLGGTVHWARVTGWERIGQWEYGGVQYYGAQAVVEVLR